MPITIDIPGADLRLRAARALSARCVAEREAAADHDLHNRERAILLLEDLLRTILVDDDGPAAVRIDLRRVMVDGQRVRVTIEGGITFHVELDHPDILWMDQRCNRCRRDTAAVRIDSLADLGAALDAPYICSTCDRSAARRFADREHAKEIRAYERRRGLAS